MAELLHYISQFNCIALTDFYKGKEKFSQIFLCMMSVC